MDKIGVVGCGLMGSGIAQVAAVAGFDTVVLEVEERFLDSGMARIRSSLERARDRGKMAAEDAQGTLGRLQGSTSVADLAECDLVIEAIVEDPQAKQELFGRLGEVLGADAVLASNTSSLTVTQLAMSSDRPDRFLGLHFFNPVPVMPLVEIVETLMVSPSVVEAASEFVDRLGKTAVRCRDRSGFIVNRLLVPYLLDAIRAFENGTASLEDIDQAMKLGCGYPMGPFTLLDFIGLDTAYAIANIMFEEYRETRFAPPPLLKQMVQAGHLGRKSGRGFFNYD